MARTTLERPEITPVRSERAIKTRLPLLPLTGSSMTLLKYFWTPPPPPVVKK
jgi:hypothetical protein